MEIPFATKATSLIDDPDFEKSLRNRIISYMSSCNTTMLLNFLPQQQQQLLVEETLTSLPPIFYISKLDPKVVQNAFVTQCVSKKCANIPLPEETQLPVELPQHVDNSEVNDSVQHHDYTKLQQSVEVTSVGRKSSDQLDAEYNLVKHNVLSDVLKTAGRICLINGSPDCTLCASWLMSSYITPCSSKYKCNTISCPNGWYPHSTKKGLGLLKKYHAQHRMVHLVESERTIECMPSVLQSQTSAIIDKLPTARQDFHKALNFLIYYSDKSGVSGLPKSKDELKNCKSSSQRPHDQRIDMVKETGCITAYTSGQFTGIGETSRPSKRKSNHIAFSVNTRLRPKRKS